MKQNYVIQFILKSGAQEDRDRVLGQLCSRMRKLAGHKYASNVCEKALESASSPMRERLINGLMADGQDGGKAIGALMDDQFAS